MNYRRSILIIVTSLLLLATAILNSRADVPQISSIAPGWGYNNGDTLISISGDKFIEGAKVSIVGNINPVGSCIENTTTKDVYVDGDYAYVINWASGKHGLAIIDITDRSQPLEVGFCENTRYREGGGVFVSGDYTYETEGFGGVRIIDIKDKACPFELSYFKTPGNDYDIVIEEEYAYVADGHMGVRILDVNNKQNPFEVGNYYDPPRRIYNIFLQEDYGYLACGYDGLKVIDMKDKARPYAIGSYDIPGYTNSVHVIGEYAYAAAGYSGLKIINISDKDHFFEVGSYSSPDSTNDVYVSGEYAYIACRSKGLRIIDINDKAQPFEIGSCDFPGQANDVQVAGDYAYVSGTSLGLRIIQFAYRQCMNIAFIDSQTIVARIPGGLPEGTYNLAVTNPDGQGAVLSDAFEMLQYGKFYPPEIYKVNGRDTVEGEDISIRVAAGQPVTLNPQARDKDPGDALIYTYSGWMNTNERATSHDDIGTYSVTITVTDKHNLSDSVTVIIEVVRIPGITSIVPDKGYNYEETEITITGVNFDDSAKVSLIVPPGLMGRVEYPYPKDVYVEGNYAYVTTGKTLKIIDIYNKEEPAELSLCDTPGAAKGVYVSGEYAYVIDYRSAPLPVGYGCCGPVYLTREYLQIVNISDIIKPHIVGSYVPSTPGASDGCRLKICQVAGNYAYVTETLNGPGPSPPQPIPDYVPIEIRYQGVRIIDINDREHPRPVGEYIPPSGPYDIYVKGEYAYIACSQDGLRIIDIQDKTQPVEVGCYDAPGIYPGQTLGVSIIDNYACVAVPEGLRIVDTSDNENPKEVGSYNVLHSQARPSALALKKIQAERGYACLATAGEGLAIIDLSDVSNPSKITSFITPSQIDSLFVQRDNIYIVHDEALEIVRFSYRQGTKISIPDSETILATIPVGVKKGIYDVIVTNPDGERGIVSEGFEVLGETLGIHMGLGPGWSMISLPVIPDSLVLSDLFPKAVVVYGYKEKSGYIRIKMGEELLVGKGYWILFNNAQDFIFTGEPIHEYSLTFSQSGWDIIGGCTYPARASADSCNIDTIYEYVIGSGYQRLQKTEFIEPGKGYWILNKNILDQCKINVKTEN